MWCCVLNCLCSGPAASIVQLPTLRQPEYNACLVCSPSALLALAARVISINSHSPPSPAPAPPPHTPPAASFQILLALPAQLQHSYTTHTHSRRADSGLALAPSRPLRFTFIISRLLPCTNYPALLFFSYV